MAGLNPSPWQQNPAQWGLQTPQAHMPGLDLRTIMQEEQQAALRGRAPVSGNAAGLNSTIGNGAGSSTHDNPFLTPSDVPIQFAGLAQQAQQQLPQQRSSGFYMRNKREEPVPGKQNWAQVTDPSMDE